MDIDLHKFGNYYEIYEVYEVYEISSTFQLPDILIMHRTNGMHYEHFCSIKVATHYIGG
jgi:hypothetical protein